MTTQRFSLSDEMERTKARQAELAAIRQKMQSWDDAATATTAALWVGFVTVVVFVLVCVL